MNTASRVSFETRPKTSSPTLNAGRSAWGFGFRFGRGAEAPLSPADSARFGLADFEPPSPDVSSPAEPSLFASSSSSSSLSASSPLSPLAVPSEVAPSASASTPAGFFLRRRRRRFFLGCSPGVPSWVAATVTLVFASVLVSPRSDGAAASEEGSAASEEGSAASEEGAAASEEGSAEGADGGVSACADASWMCASEVAVASWVLSSLLMTGLRHTELRRATSGVPGEGGYP